MRAVDTGTGMAAGLPTRPVSGRMRGVDHRATPRSRRLLMQKYVCTVCGYVYDPAQGDSAGGVKPGTPFEKLPADWVCPVCGAGKDDFEKSA